MKIKVINKDNRACYFPDDVDYRNNAINTEAKTIDGEPYIEITQEEWAANRGNRMVIEDGLYKKYIKTDDELLQEAINQATTNRTAYLQSTDWYILREYDQPDSYPQEIKDKRILARTEINQIELETNIHNITIQFE